MIISQKRFFVILFCFKFETFKIILEFFSLRYSEIL